MRSKVFREATSLLPGEDWRNKLIQEVKSSDWLLALIGPRWLDPGPDGKARLDGRADMVRIEIATALQHRVAVLPVMVLGGEMPNIRDLPRDVAMVTRRQKLDWPKDLERIVTTVRGRVKAPVFSVPTALVGTWVGAEETGGSTYEFSKDGTYGHLGILQQHSASEEYRFEVWEEGVVSATSSRLSLQPFRAQASQSSSDHSRSNYSDSPRELVNREFGWRFIKASPPVVELTAEGRGVTRLEFQGIFDLAKSSMLSGMA